MQWDRIMYLSLNPAANQESQKRVAAIEKILRE